MNHTNLSKNYRRWLGGALLLAAAAALVWTIYRPRPLLVEVATVSTGNFEQSIEEDGRLRLKNRYVITAPTPADGKVDSTVIGCTRLSYRIPSTM